MTSKKIDNVDIEQRRQARLAKLAAGHRKARQAERDAEAARNGGGK